MDVDFMPRRHPTSRARRAFTLVELLVALSLLGFILAIVLQITWQTSEVWRRSTANIQTFQEARAAFEAMTRNLSQATLNTYYDYYDAQNRPRVQLTSPVELAQFNPATYDRISDLHFISGQSRTLLQGTPITTQSHAVFFQAPLGYSVGFNTLDSALNATGYFLRFDNADETVPEHVRNTTGYAPRPRYRLYEMMQRTEHLSIYASPNSSEWFTQHAAGNSRVIAENVIALVLLPKLAVSEDPSSIALAPAFNYNTRVPLGATSDPAWNGFPGNNFNTTSMSGEIISATRHHQLPPMMHVIMVVIDEASAARLQGAGDAPPSAINLGDTNLFRDAANLSDDIAAVEDILNAAPGNLTGNTIPLSYRVFNTEIIMREAKWSPN